MLLPDGTNLCQPLAAQCERVAHDPAHIVLDAAAATVAAIQATTAGLYNITDDEPAPVSVWLPFLAPVLDAKAPKHVPTRLARMALGEYGVGVMTELRGASNHKAKTLLRWKLRWPTWREGFEEVITGPLQSARNGATRAVA